MTRRRLASLRWFRQTRQSVTLFTLLALFPTLAFAQSGSPFDTGFTNLQTLFTGTIAKVTSLIAIVIGGYQFAHGEPGAKKIATSTTGTGACQLLSRRVERSRGEGKTHPAPRATPTTVDRA
jgi:type IV secretory pathway VirB2 component (pilin)